MDQQKSKLFLLILLIASLLGVSLYIAFVTSRQNQQPIDSDASEEVDTPVLLTIPKEIIVSNLTSNSATISWYTEKEVKGYIKYNKAGSETKIIKRDYRDSGTSSSRNLHYVQLTGLESQSEYQIEVYVDDVKYEDNPLTSFKTLKQTDSIATPNNLLITTPSTLTEAIVYSHAKKDSKYSTTISTLTTNKNISLVTTNLKDFDTGEPFDVVNGEILISVTNKDGKRTRKGISGKESKVTLSSFSSNELIYSSKTTFTADSISTIPNTPVVPAQGTVNNPPAAPVTTPTPASNNVTSTPSTIPKTALKIDGLIKYGQVALAFIFIGLGIKLKYSKV